MCRSVICDLCSKRTWTGCGQHIPQAMASYPKAQWCDCLPKYNDEKPASYPPGFGSARTGDTPAQDRPESKCVIV